MLRRIYSGVYLVSGRVLGRVEQELHEKSSESDVKRPLGGVDPVVINNIFARDERQGQLNAVFGCLLYTSPSPRD